jgi:hypothetical protein
VVELQPEHRHHALELGGVLVGQRLRRDAAGRSRLLDLDPVLVGPGA